MTEPLLLFASYAFDALGYRRFEWKCHNHNEPCKRAALRFGFTFEGIFRQHMVSKGANRDTAWFAMIDRDRPRLKAGSRRGCCLAEEHPISPSGVVVGAALASEELKGPDDLK